MPTEAEELRLIVVLTDNASGALASLRQQLSQLNSADAKGNVESFKRHQGEITDYLKKFSTTIGGGESALLSFAGRLGLVGAGIAAFGAIVYEELKALGEFGDKFTDLQNKAKAFGVHPAVLKSIEEQLTRIGVSADVADRNVAKFNEAYVEMGRAGSKSHLELVQKAGRYGQQMEEGIQRVLRQQTEVGRINEVLSQAQEVYNNRLKETGGDIVRATQFTKEFLAAWGLDPLFARIEHLQEVSEQEKKRVEALDEAGLRWHKGLADIKKEWDDWMDDMSVSALAPDGLIVKGLEKSLELVKKLHEAWMDPEKWVREHTPTPAPKTPEEEATGAYWGQPKPLRPKSTPERPAWASPTEKPLSSEETAPLAPPITEGPQVKEWSQEDIEKQKKVIGDLAEQAGLSNIGKTAPKVDYSQRPGIGGHVGRAAHLLSSMEETSEDRDRVMIENTDQLKKLNDYLAAQQLGLEGGGGGGGAGLGGGGSAPVSMAGLEGLPGMPSSGTPAAPDASGRHAAPAAPLAEPKDDRLASAASPDYVPSERDRGPVPGGSSDQDESASGGGSLADQRRSLWKDVSGDPATKHLLHQMMDTEGGGAATVEALFNRTAMIRKRIPGYSIKDELHSGFYNPINKGIAQQRHISAGQEAEYNKILGKVVGGSDIIKGRTDQGMVGDPNWQGPGVVKAPGSTDIYNYWKGERRGISFSHEDAARFAAAQEAMVAADRGVVAADRGVVDKRSVKTVKVDATGKVNIDIGGGGGSDATLGGDRLFKPTAPERSTQMSPAETGPMASE